MDGRRPISRGQASLGTAEYANYDTHFKGAVAGAPASGLLEIVRDIMPSQLTALNQFEAESHIPLEERNAVRSFATILAYGALVGVGIKAEKPDFDYLSLFYPNARGFAQSAEGTNGEDGICLHGIRDLFQQDLIQFMQNYPDQSMMDYPGIDIEAFQSHPVLLEFFAKPTRHSKARQAGFNYSRYRRYKCAGSGDGAVS